MEHWNLDIIGFRVIGAGWQIEKKPEASPSLPNSLQDSWKWLPLLILAKFGNLMSCVAKDILKKAPCLM